MVNFLCKEASMSDEVVKPGNEEALSPSQSLSEAIQDKISIKYIFIF